MQERNLVALPLQLGKQGAGRMSMVRVLRMRHLSLHHVSQTQPVPLKLSISHPNYPIMHIHPVIQSRVQ